MKNEKGAAGADGTDGTDVAGTGGTGTTENESRLFDFDIGGTESTRPPIPSTTPTAEADGHAVLHAVNDGACRLTRRDICTYFHWGGQRAAAALRAARALLRGSVTGHLLSPRQN